MVSRDSKYQFITREWSDYQLLVLSNGWKLERFGDIKLLRPDVNADETSGVKIDELRKRTDFQFHMKEGQKGSWESISGKPLDLEWTMKWEGVSLRLKLTKFKHIGVFPEQAFNWKLIHDHLTKVEEGSMLNLFGYTGAASIVARAVGAEVVHVDSVKQVIDWANENQQLSGLDGIKWIRDDAFKVAERMARRGQVFDVVLMDPPAFGRAGKRIWKIEEQLEALIRYGITMLKPNGKLILNTYTPKVSIEDLSEITYGISANLPSIRCGSLQIEASDGNVLPTGALLLVERGH